MSVVFGGQVSLGYFMQIAEHVVHLIHSAQSPEKNALKLRPLIADASEPLLWLFLDQDFRHALSWEKALGVKFKRIDIGRLLDTTAGELRQPFIAWVDRLHVRYGTDRHWWFSEISERNTMVSPLFLFVCYLAVTKECLSREQRPCLIVAQSWGLIEALRLLSRSLSVKVRVVSPWQKYIHRFKQFGGLIKALGYFLAVSVYSQVAAWTTRRGCVPPSFAGPSERVLLDTFFEETSLSSDGIFRDRWFPFLHEWLVAQRLEVWVLPTMLVRRQFLADSYRRMRENSTRFLIPEDWLKGRDYLDALVCGLKAWLRPGAVGPLHGLDVRSLVSEERWRQGMNFRSLQTCLISRIPGRLKAAGFIPDKIIEWSENQTIDKALVIGCRCAFPKAIYTAVQNTPLPPNLLNLFPTAVECEYGVTADREVCSGPLATQVLAEQSQGRLNAITGCGLRYAYLWKVSSNHSRSSDNGGSLVVLVALPISVSLAVEILDLMTPLYLERDLTTWYVKPHPIYTVEHFKQFVRSEVLERLTFIEGSLGDWIDKVDVVITAGSGVALEAVALGLPVIQVGSRTGLNYDSLAWFDGLRDRMCYSCEDVRRELDKIEAFTAADYAALQQRGREVLEEWFAPLTEDALQKFIRD